MTVDRPCGWIPDPPGATYASAARGLGRTIGATPDAAALIHEEWDPAQIGNSCVGHMLAEMGYGLTGVRYSPYHSYFWGAAHDQGRDLADIGVSLSASIASAEQHGLALWDDWNPDDHPEIRSNPLLVPPAFARVRAQRRNVDVVLVTRDKVETMSAAIAHGYPPGIVVRVDEAFDRTGRDGFVPDESGSVRGWHAINPWSYTTIDGERWFRCLVHWGRGFGDDGGVYISARRIERSPMVVYAKGLS